MKNLLKIVFSIALVILVIGTTEAQQKVAQTREYGARQARQTAGANGLNLTEDQRSKMKTLKLQLQKEMLPIKNEIGENSARIRSLSTLDKVDLKAINKIIDENGALKTNIAKLLMSNRQQVRVILNEEQRIIFDTQKLYKHQLYRQGARAKRMAMHKTKMHLKEEGKPKR